MLLPHFFVVGVFIVWTLFHCAATIVCLVVPPWRAVYPYAWRSLVGSTIGFFLGNILAFLPGLLALVPVVDEIFGNLAFMWCATLAPFAGSALGVGAGMWVGIRRALGVLRRRRTITDVV